MSDPADVRAYALCAVLCCSACAGQPSTAQIISVDTIPVVDFTSANPDIDPLFERPAGATMFSNGMTVVGDYWAAAVTAFEKNGKLVKRLGGHGQGPDAFGGAIVFRGQCATDSAFVLILDRMKVAVIDTSATVRRTYTPKYEFSGAPCNGGPNVARWQGTLTELPKPGDAPLRGQLIAGDFNGERSTDLGEFVIGEYGPARPQSKHFARDDRIYMGSGDDDEIDIYSKSGRKLKTMKLGLQRQSMSERHYDAALDEYVTYLVLREDRRQSKEFFRQRFPKPSRLAAFFSFYVDAHEILWVTTSPPGEPSVVHAYSVTDDSRIGTYGFPVELRIFEIGNDYMLAAFEDDEGFPHVARYRISRT